MHTIWDIQESKQETAEVENSDLFSPLAKALLAKRSVLTSEEINRFLFPRLENLHDPMIMKGIRDAVKRILSAIERKELILVHGDYDVDGVTGAAILAKTFEKLNARHYTFLPERSKDGYGVSLRAIEEAKARGVSLLVTVDCGITAIKQVEFANQNGIDVIILDHHQIHGGSLPSAYATINPLQEDCPYPFKELSAGGLAFKLSQALVGNFAYSLLDLAALSSVCDVAPLVGENRIIVKHGLELLTKRSNKGLAKLAAVAKFKSIKVSTGHIGFVFGPRINASGRMSSADTAFKLLTAGRDEEAENLARILEQENQMRQREDREVLKQAIRQVEARINFSRDRVVVVWQEGWHPGVIGIVAQRLVERFGRPACVIAIENGAGKGSARSIRGFHLFHALESCRADLKEFGGHELAAGFSILPENLQNFSKHLNEFAWTLPADFFVKRFRVDAEIDFQELTPAFFRELELFEPFGAGNPKPVFVTRNVKSKTPPAQINGTTLKWWVSAGSSTFEAVWNQRQGIERTPPEQEVPYDIIYSPTLKDRDGIESVSLEVKDLKAKYE